MAYADYRHRVPLRVRWAEVDMQKIVFNAHYLMYVDTAMMDYWRALALPYEASMVALGGDMYVKKATLEYHASAQLDDLLDIGMRCARVGNSSVLFEAGIFRGEQLLVSGELVYVFADPATQTSKPVPQALREVFAAFEAGEPMVQVRCGAWQDLGPEAARLREAVFVAEQRIAPDIERDALDADAVHVLIANRLGMPIATGRLLVQAPGVGRIGRMAVDRLLRGGGWGLQTLRALEDAARARGDRQMLLHAQVQARGFYEEAGYQVQGEPWQEAGIAHLAMLRSL